FSLHHSRYSCLYSFPTRRSSDLESFLISPMVVVFLIVALFRQRLMTRSWKSAARYWLRPAGAMLGTLILLNSAVDAANYRAFHRDRKSTRLNSSHQLISYAVFFL